MSRFLIPLFIGLLSGALSSAFLHALNFVTDLRLTHPELIWGLPFFGLILSFVIMKIPHHINQGVPYIIQEADHPQAKVSPWMTPFIFLSSLGTHLFGGSAGREGVGVIMGASIAHVLPSGSKPSRELLIYGGMAAGFSSIFGTPMAAIVFSFELFGFREIKRWDLLLYTSLASLSAFFVSLYLGPDHQEYHVSLNLSEVLPYVLICGVISGIGGQLFYWGLKGYTKLISSLFPRLPMKLFFGGLMISVLVFFTESYPYIGIGTDVISRSFTETMSYYDFTIKALFTIMTISIGFKGGEVTPLFFVGSTFSNWFSGILNLRNFGLSSSLGMVGMFGAVTGTPVASMVIAFELFGLKVGLCAVGSCLIARILMGKKSIYRH